METHVFLCSARIGFLTGAFAITVPEDHLVPTMDAALDLSWLRSVLATHYSPIERPSIDPELMIRVPSLS